MPHRRVKADCVDSLRMPQFGAGPQLAAQCPPITTPDGWRAWTDADGPVPDGLAARAAALATDPTALLGATESYPLPGVVTLIRVEPRVWGKQGDSLVQGCFRVSGIYLPSDAASGAGTIAPTSDRWTRIATIATVISLTVGTAATLAAWEGRKKK